MVNHYVLVPSTTSTMAECYHLPRDDGELHPYCTPSESYERISRQTARTLDLRLCRRCAQKNGSPQNGQTETTCPFCTADVVKTRLPHHLQNCPQSP